jgi:WbqC-like protein family
MSVRRIVAIHQPNFFPWLGYFDKMARADVFVCLDDAQFAKSGAGTWSNRVRLRVGGSPQWVTMPVRRDYHGTRLTNEMRIDERQPWRPKLLKTIELHYKKARYFDSVFPTVSALVEDATDRLADYNRAAIEAIAQRVRIDTGKCVVASSLAVEARATDRLIALVQRVGGTAYLSGGGAGGYQDDQTFGAAGIELMFQQFEHPVYPQGETEFCGGLSIIDALMHCGFDGTADLLRSPR